MATLKNLTINDTGFVQLAAGNTAERPATPVAGMMRYNTDFNRNEIYDGAKWVLTNGSNYATGGVVTTVGGYRIHTFTTTGATAFTMTYPGTVEVMLVGGGGGGATIGGGGGAGGFIYESQVQLEAGAYTVNVGGGGVGETAVNSLAGPGGNSSIVGASLTNLTAIGGGRGLSYTAAQAPAPHGYGGSGGGGPGGHGPTGAGGGGAWPQAPMGHGVDPDHFWHEGSTIGYNSANNRDQISLGNGPNAGGGGVRGQGHPGGAGAHGGGYYWVTNTVVHAGGGGGGAGSHGKPTLNSGTNGNGGAGVASQITGTVTYYAGGGGSGTHQPGTAGHYGLSGALGGVGGGGVGGGSGVNGGTGGTNTGGGGGGGHHVSPNISGGGGPGIVVVRYRDV